MDVMGVYLVSQQREPCTHSPPWWYGAPALERNPLLPSSLLSVYLVCTLHSNRTSALSLTCAWRSGSARVHPWLRGFTIKNRITWQNSSLLSPSLWELLFLTHRPLVADWVTIRSLQRRKSGPSGEHGWALALTLGFVLALTWQQWDLQGAAFWIWDSISYVKVGILLERWVFGMLVVEMLIKLQLLQWHAILCIESCTKWSC